MATYYWVGGTGTWGLTTTNWSSSSGGTGGAGLPTQNDDVIFDTNSGTGTVSISGGVACCRDFTVTASQALTFSGQIGGLTNEISGCYGNATLPSGGSTVFTSFTLCVAGTSTASLTTNGKSIYSLETRKYGGVLNLADDLNTSILTFAYGTINTNNYNINCVNVSSDTAQYNAILNLGSSTITASGVSINFNGNLTINPGTSTLVSTNTQTTFQNGSGKNWNNVNFTGGGGSQIVISGNNTFNTISVTATSTTKQLVFSGTSNTINTLTTTGTTVSNRVIIYTNTGSPVTLTISSFGSVANTDWQNVNLAGAVSPWSAPFGVRNLGYTSGINFDTTPLYWIGGTGNWTDPTKWSTSSGGSTANVLPGGNNTVYFDGGSGTGTVTCTSGWCNDFVATSSGALTFSNGQSILGSSAIGGSGTFTSWTPTYIGSATGKTITSNGKTISTITINGIGGSWSLADALTTSSVSVTAGSFLTNNYNVSTGTFQSTGTTSRSISLGSSTVTVSQYPNLVATNLTFNAGTSTINCTGTSSGVFAGSGLTFYNVSFTATNAGRTIVVSGQNTFNNLTIAPPATTGYVTVSLGANQTVSGTLTVTSSGTANRRVLISTNTTNTATQYTITANAVSLAYTDFFGIVGAGAASWTGTSIGNGTFNSGITFTAPKTVYWNLAAGGSWMTSTAWAPSSGGTADVSNFPLPQDTAIIDDAGLNAAATISIGTSGVLLPNINFSTRTLAMTFSFNASGRFCGNLTWDANVTSTGTTVQSFYGSTTITSAGVTLTPSITIFSSATLTTADVLTFSNDIQNSGTLTLGANAFFRALTLGSVSTTNFGSYKITLTGNARTIFTGSATQTVTGTPVIDCNYSGSTGTRTFSSPSNTAENSTISFNITAGTDVISLSNFASKDLDFTGFSGSCSGGSIYIYGNLTFSAGMTLGTINNSFFTATGGNKNITTNGKAFSGSIYFKGGTWNLQDNLTCNGGIFGTEVLTSNFVLNTNNYNLNLSSVSTSFYFSVSPYTSTINLGSSTVSVARMYQAFGATNITVNGGTSTLNTTYGVAFQDGNTINLYDVNITPGANPTGSGTAASMANFAGVASARNVTVNAGTAYQIMLAMSSTTISGTLSINGGATYKTIVRRSGYTSTTPVISAAAVSLSNLDIVGITASGTAWSGSDLADGGGNTNITFNVTPRTLYWVGGTGTIAPATTANWSLSSGGAGGEAFPRICDTVIFDSNSGAYTATITTAAAAYLPTISFQPGFVSNISGYITCFGDFTAQANMALGTGVYLCGYNPTYTVNGNTNLSTLNLDLSGQITLTEDLYLDSALTCYSGSINTNDKTITVGNLNASQAFELNLTSSVVNVYYGVNISGGSLINAGTSEIKILNASSGQITFGKYSRSLNKLTIAPTTGAGQFSFSTESNQTINTLSLVATQSYIVNFTGGYSYTIDDWQISGSAGKLVTVKVLSGTTPFTLVSSGGVQSADYLNISYSTATPSSTWYAGLNSVDSGNNTGWIFDEPPPESGGGLFFGSNF